MKNGKESRANHGFAWSEGLSLQPNGVRPADRAPWNYSFVQLVLHENKNGRELLGVMR